MAFLDNFLPYLQLPPTIYRITLYTPGHLEISWKVFAKKSADILSFRHSFTLSSLHHHPSFMDYPRMHQPCVIILKAEADSIFSSFLSANNTPEKRIKSVDSVRMVCIQLLDVSDMSQLSNVNNLGFKTWKNICRQPRFFPFKNFSGYIRLKVMNVNKTRLKSIESKTARKCS